MKLDIYQIDAFSQRVFSGNAAAVCPLATWLDDETMQAIAMENNLSETAFFVSNPNGYALRWFTPNCEVDLCGHATLAAAFVINRYVEPGQKLVRFSTRSGTLSVEVSGQLLTMDFPVDVPQPVETDSRWSDALGAAPIETYVADYYLAVFASQQEIASVQPNARAISEFDRPGVIVTAPGNDVDFVSRFFAPKVGILEDPVTGSAHCILTPYWARRLEKNKLLARQVSTRGGDLICELRGDRVSIAGYAVEYMNGTIEI